MKENIDMSKAETARYMSEMLSSMRQLAVQQDMTFLVYLLDMACIEAVNQSTTGES